MLVLVSGDVVSWSATIFSRTWDSVGSAATGRFLSTSSVSGFENWCYDDMLPTWWEVTCVLMVTVRWYVVAGRPSLMKILSLIKRKAIASAPALASRRCFTVRVTASAFTGRGLERLAGGFILLMFCCHVCSYMRFSILAKKKLQTHSY